MKKHAKTIFAFLIAFILLFLSINYSSAATLTPTEGVVSMTITPNTIYPGDKVTIKVKIMTYDEFGNLVPVQDETLDWLRVTYTFLNKTDNTTREIEVYTGSSKVTNSNGEASWIIDTSMSLPGFTGPYPVGDYKATIDSVTYGMYYTNFYIFPPAPGFFEKCGEAIWEAGRTIGEGCRWVGKKLGF